MPKPEIKYEQDAKIGIIAFGSSDVAMVESRDQLAEEYKLPTSYFRLRALPFTDELRKFVEKHERVYVVEQNRDAQLRDLVRLELPDLATKIKSILHL